MNRKEAVNSALASMRMEGFVFTDKELAIFNKLANDEISSDDVRNMANEEVKEMRLKHPELFATRKESIIKEKL